MTTLLKGLAEEKIVFTERSKTFKLSFPLKGIVRVIDKKGHTLGIVLDNQILQEIEEELETTSPEFWRRIDQSRKSGRVSSKTIEHRLGLK